MKKWLTVLAAVIAALGAGLATLDGALPDGLRGAPVERSGS